MPMTGWGLTSMNTSCPAATAASTAGWSSTGLRRLRYQYAGRPKSVSPAGSTLCPVTVEKTSAVYAGGAGSGSTSSSSASSGSTWGEWEA